MNSKNDADDQIPSARKPSSGKKRSKRTKNHEHGLVIISNKSGADGDYEEVVCPPKHEKKGDHKKHDRSSAKDSIPKSDIPENDLSIKIRHKSRKEKSDKEKYNIEKYLEDTSKISDKYPPYNISSLSLNSCEIILKKEKRKHRPHRENTIHIENSKTSGSFQETSIFPTEDARAYKKKKRHRERTEERSIDRLTENNTQVLFSQVKTKNPFKEELKHRSKEREKESVKKSHKHQKKDEHKHSRHCEKCKHSKSEEYLSEKVKEKKSHKHSQKSKDPMYFGVYDKYFILEKRSKTDLGIKKMKEKKPCPSRDLISSKQSEDNDKAKDKGSRHRTKHRQTKETEFLDYKEPEKVDEELKNYLTKFQNLIDKKLEAILNIAKNKENPEEAKERTNKKRIKRKTKLDRDEKRNSNINLTQDEANVLVNNKEYARRKIEFSKVSNKKEEISGDFEKIHAALEEEHRRNLDRFFSTSKSSELLKHRKHESSEKRSQSSKSAARKRRIENYDSVGNIPSISPGDSLVHLNYTKNNSASAKSKKQKKIKEKYNFNLDRESDFIEQAKTHKKHKRSKNDKNAFKTEGVEDNRGAFKTKFSNHDDHKRATGKRSSHASEDQNDGNIHGEAGNKGKKKQSLKRSQQIINDEAENAKLNRKNNKIKPIEKRGKTPHLVDRIPKREYHLECQTVSVVGIPSQFQDESAILTNIQTSTSLKMANSDEEPVEKKKKTKRFKVYYKYCIADNKCTNFESGHSSGEKSIISDSHKRISDNSEEAGECNSPGKEHEKQIVVLKTVKNKPILEINNMHKRKYRVTPSIDLRLNNIDEERTSSDNSKQINCKYFNVQPLHSSNSDYSLKVIKSPPKISPRTSPVISNKVRKIPKINKAEIWNKNLPSTPTTEATNRVKWKKPRTRFISKSDINISYASLTKKVPVSKNYKLKSGIPVPKASYLRVGRQNSTKNANQHCQCQCQFFGRNSSTKNVLRDLVKDCNFREHIDQYDMYLLQCLELSSSKMNSEKNIGTETTTQHTQVTNTSNTQQQVVNKKLKFSDEYDSYLLKQLEMYEGKKPIKTADKVDKNLGTEPEKRPIERTTEIGVGVDFVDEENDKIQILEKSRNVKKMADAAVEAHVVDMVDASESGKLEILYKSAEKKRSTSAGDTPRTKKRTIITQDTEYMKESPPKSSSKSYNSSKVHNQARALPKIDLSNITRGILKNRTVTKEDFTQMSKETFQSELQKCIALNTSLMDLRNSKEFVKTHFASLKTSKSEANLKSITVETSESKITSLICLHKYEGAKLSECTRSHAHSLDHYFKSIISDNPHKSTLFLTKTFKTDDMSSYQKRKIYDESIRRRMKRKLQFNNKLFRPQVYEVRFLTVERANSQSNTIGMSSEPCRQLSYDNFSQYHQAVFKPKMKPFKQLRMNKPQHTRDCLTEVLQDVDFLNKTKKKAFMNDTVQEIFKSEKQCIKESFSKTDTTYTALETNTEDTSIVDDRSSSLDSEETKRQTSIAGLVQPRNENLNESGIRSKYLEVQQDCNNNLDTDSKPNIEKNISLLIDLICKSIIKYVEKSWLDGVDEAPEINSIKTIFKSNNFQDSLNSSKFGKSSVDNEDKDFPKRNLGINKSVADLLSNLASGPRFLDKNISINSKKKSAYLGYTFDSNTTNQDRPKCESPDSEESGYSSRKSRTWSSVTDFFKKPHIAALLKPCSDSEMFEESKNWDTYEEMMKKCHDYARKVRTESQRDTKDNQAYQEISLDIMLGRKSSTNLANFNSNCSLCREVSGLKHEENTAAYDSISCNQDKIERQREEDKTNTEVKQPTTNTKECNVVFSNTNLNTSCITLIDSVVGSNVSFNLPAKPSIASKANKICLDNPLVGVISVDIPEKLNGIATKNFFENLVSLYEKEVTTSMKLYQDNNFFENDLLTVTTACDASSDNSFSTKKRKGMKKIFGKIFGMKKAPKDVGKANQICKTEENKFDSHQEETLKTLAQNARKYFSMFVQAVKANREINDEIKICGLQKLLENIEKGQFTFLKSDTQINFEEEMKKQVKESFNSIYKVAFAEASKIRRSLTITDLKLIETFVCKYRIGMLSKTDFIASSIGRGVLRTESDLRAAVTYLMRQPTAEVDLKKFEEYCQFHMPSPS